MGSANGVHLAMPKPPQTEAEATVVAKVLRWRQCGLEVRQIEALLRAARHAPLSASAIRSVLRQHRAQSRRSPEL